MKIFNLFNQQKEYGFKIGEEREILIKSENEKSALVNLIINYWDIIDEAGNIELLGEVIEKKKLSEMKIKDEDEENVD